jgi:hypothetical protein
MKNRKGKIYFDMSHLKEIMNDEKIATEIFSKFYPLLIQELIDYNREGRWYMGFSPHFDEVPDGTLIPEYRCWTKIKQEKPEDEREITVTFEKI